MTKSKDSILAFQGRRTLLVGVEVTREGSPDVGEESVLSLQELERLASTLGLTVVHSEIQRRRELHPATYMGPGKAAELSEWIQSHRADCLIVDGEISGSQQRTLESKLQCPVLDRTGIILEIFSRHARSREAKAQVELASLEYVLSRVKGQWAHLERQKGGIGLRGIGERQIELDRRLIRDKMSRLKAEMASFARRRTGERQHRENFFRVALVGYTNAGKSTLMNQLTASQVLVEDKLFATLDSTIRLLDPKARPPILLSDTVGFIRHLPHSLVASFRSTLAEVQQADLLLHVVDLSSSDYVQQKKTTEDVLQELGVDLPTLVVFNKYDKVRRGFIPQVLERSTPNSIVISALYQTHIRRLRRTLSRYLEQRLQPMRLSIPYAESALLARIQQVAKVQQKHYHEDSCEIEILIREKDADYLKLSRYQLLAEAL